MFNYLFCKVQSVKLEFEELQLSCFLSSVRIPMEIYMFRAIKVQIIEGFSPVIWL